MKSFGNLIQVAKNGKMLGAGPLIFKFNLNHCEEILRPGRYSSRKRQVDRCSVPVHLDDRSYVVNRALSNQCISQSIENLSGLIVCFPKIVKLERREGGELYLQTRVVGGDDGAS